LNGAKKGKLRLVAGASKMCGREVENLDVEITG